MSRTKDASVIKNKNPKVNVSKEQNESIAKYLELLGVPNNLNGFDYLIEAISFCVSDYSYILNPIKYLYIDIANEYDSKMENIKTSIERGLERAWYLGSTEMFEELFGYSIKDRRKCPSVKKFLFLTTKYLTSCDDYNQDDSIKYSEE